MASLFLALLLLPFPKAAAEPLRDNDLKIAAPYAVLMEKETGEVLYEKGAHERTVPASVTKVMTLLLIVEDIESGKITPDDTVTASARAASFGGSCVYLEEGEQMSVDEMLKCIAVVSANDCAVAMAEHLCGSEEVFVERMNRAKTVLQGNLNALKKERGRIHLTLKTEGDASAAIAQSGAILLSEKEQEYRCHKRSNHAAGCFLHDLSHSFSSAIIVSALPRLSSASNSAKGLAGS